MIELLSVHGFRLLWDNVGTTEQGDIVLIRRDEPGLMTLKAYVAVISAWILSWLSRTARSFLSEDSGGYRVLKSIKDKLT
ncbi:MAG: hypothetical protein HUJ31_09295 [Pseudomonadales bacterium]|nr:hypothetical protein [Pseudomonadales bacterium]